MKKLIPTLCLLFVITFAFAQSEAPAAPDSVAVQQAQGNYDALMIRIGQKSAQAEALQKELDETKKEIQQLINQRQEALIKWIEVQIAFARKEPKQTPNKKE